MRISKVLLNYALFFVLGFMTKTYIAFVKKKLVNNRLAEHSAVAKEEEKAQNTLFDMISDSDTDSEIDEESICEE